MLRGRSIVVSQPLCVVDRCKEWLQVSASGRMLDLDTRWGLGGIAAHTCSPIPSNYAVPTTLAATGLLRAVLDTGVLQVRMHPNCRARTPVMI